MEHAAPRENLKGYQTVLACDTVRDLLARHSGGTAEDAAAARGAPPLQSTCAAVQRRHLRAAATACEKKAGAREEQNAVEESGKVEICLCLTCGRGCFVLTVACVNEVF